MSKTYIAYTMGNKKSYDRAFKQLSNGEIPELKKIGRTQDEDDEYYSGGCCWPSYPEAMMYIEKNKDEIPYTPDIYGILLPNGWKEDTTDDTFADEGFYSLLVDADLVKVNSNGDRTDG